MFNYKITITLILISIGFFTKQSLQIVERPKIGAYYFDGWRNNNTHLTYQLVNNYKERMPAWGWNSANNMDTEILAASNAGLEFFSFCWYLRDTIDVHYRNDPYNQGLFQFVQKDGLHLMKFCLMVANHEGSEIGPGNWNFAMKLWIEMFKQKAYLNVNSKPIIIFFSTAFLIKKFGSAAKVKLAFDQFRDLCRKENLSGVSIAACVSGNRFDCANAVSCGVDILTGYNHAYEGVSGYNMVLPIDNLKNHTIETWNNLSTFNVPVIPTLTLNWDPRPWKLGNELLEKSHRYEGYSPNTVFVFFRSLLRWIDLHPQAVTSEKLGLVYAWNEYGEGAWLTPGKNDSLLISVKNALLLKN